jgi:protein phosphatase 1 regulatory subunit 37
VFQNRSLQFLDLSQNALDKKSVEYIAASLAQVPEQGLNSLKLDDCSLKPLSLEVLGAKTPGGCLCII